MTDESQYVPFSPPLIGEEEIAEVVDTLRSDWITTGPKTQAFEQQFADYVGAPAALALNSCTAGLHLALLACGIGPGDEVITTPMTFAATVNVIEHVGARPILVDVEPDTLNIDPQRIEAAVTSRTRAVMPVHFSGHPVDMAAVQEIASRHGLCVIEDAAHALPAAYRGTTVGAGPNLVSFSFYATKNLTTAEGGMLTGSTELLDRVRPYVLHGISRDAWNRYGKGGSWFYDVVLPGFKYNMTDIQASLGLWQLKKLAMFHQRRREIVAAYTAAFSTLDDVELPCERLDVRHAWHLYVLRLCGADAFGRRDALNEQLSQRGIGTSLHFIPIHLHSFYRDKYGYRPDDFPVALDNFQRMLSLPLSPRLSDQQVQQVIGAVCESMETCGRRAA